MLEGVRKIPQTPELQGVTFVAGLIGVTAWYRVLKTDEERKKADDMLSRMRAHMGQELQRLDLSGVEMRVEEIASKREAEYELRAVEYAVAQSKLPPPLATLAGGSGSVQVTGLDSYFSFAAALKVGGKMVQSPGGVSEWQSQVERELSNAASASAGFTNNLKSAASVEGGGNIVLISAFFYAAVAAKIVDRKSEEYKYLPAEEVIGKLQALVDSTPPAAADAEAPTEAEKKKLDAHHKDVANASRLITCLTSLFGANLANVRCLFARDWTINGSKFRTTWTAGWFLEKQAQIDVR